VIPYWIPKNLMHIAEHDVEPYEAMYVIDHARPPYPRKTGNEKFLVWGQTEGGRYLQVVFIYPDDDEIDIGYLEPEDRLAFLADEDVVVYVVHARDLTNNEKRAFRRLRGNR
jgi:hypothetical protein